MITDVTTIGTTFTSDYGCTCHETYITHCAAQFHRRILPERKLGFSARNRFERRRLKSKKYVIKFNKKGL